MKCRSKLRYDCFYLTKDNIEEFLEWFSKYNIVNTYKKCNDYLEVCCGFGDDGYEFYYNHWQMFKDGSFYECSDGIFKIAYELVDEDNG